MILRRLTLLDRKEIFRVEKEILIYLSKKLIIKIFGKNNLSQENDFALYKFISGVCIKDGHYSTYHGRIELCLWRI